MCPKERQKVGCVSAVCLNRDRLDVSINHQSP